MLPICLELRLKCPVSLCLTTNTEIAQKCPLAFICINKAVMNVKCDGGSEIYIYIYIYLRGVFFKLTFSANWLSFTLIPLAFTNDVHRVISQALRCRYLCCPVTAAAVISALCASLLPLQLHVRTCNSDQIKTSLRKSRMWFPPPASQHCNEGISSFVLKSLRSQKWGLGLSFPRANYTTGRPERSILTCIIFTLEKKVVLFCLLDRTPTDCWLQNG